jgi:pimeloyl-ACP methyl ester carboxylesterase
MKLVQLGTGAPLVFVPGLQGRWEYARPTVEALAEHFRVLTFSLGDEPNWNGPFDRRRGFDAYGDQIAAAVDEAGIARAVVCGLSFGGLATLNFASRFGDRVDALVLASTPGPGFTLRPRHQLYTRVPWLFGLLFLVETPFRASAELRAALPSSADRRAFAWKMARTSVTAPLSASRMAARARLIGSFDAAAACGRITAPTLVVTGEPSLDFVVSVEGTSQYSRLIAGARTAVLDRTGHQGTLTRPLEFAAIVRRFVAESRHAAA